MTARHEVEIHAPLDTVRQLHTGVNAWPRWQIDITAAHLDGAFAVGTSFDWAGYGLSVRSTIYDVADRTRVLWGGTAGGITGVHEWTFRAMPAGVHVTTSESFAGEPVKADAAGIQALLDASLISWLGHLKVVAETHA